MAGEYFVSDAKKQRIQDAAYAVSQAHEELGVAEQNVLLFAAELKAAKQVDSLAQHARYVKQQKLARLQAEFKSACNALLPEQLIEQ